MSFENLPESDNSLKMENLIRVPLSKVLPNPDQPRKYFSQKALDELAQSIQTQGILQPLVVRVHPSEKEHYELVAGERRWRALKQLHFQVIPVILKKVSDDDLLEVALLENIQRENLTIIEEAQSYQDLLQTHGYTQDELAKRIGKERSTIANLIRLLQLPSALKNDLETGRMSTGHARALLALPGSIYQMGMRERILRHSWSVRETERQVKLELEIIGTSREVGRSLEQTESGENEHPISKAETNIQLQNLEEELQRRLRTKVSIKYQDGKGQIQIDYFSLEEFERLYEQLLSS